MKMCLGQFCYISLKICQIDYGIFILILNIIYDDDITNIDAVDTPTV